MNTEESWRILEEHFRTSLDSTVGTDNTICSREYLAALIADYLESLKTNDKIHCFNNVSVARPVSFAVGKTGNVFLDLECIEPIPHTWSEKVKNRRVGPHRPRRVARLWMKSRMSQLIAYASIVPIRPLSHILVPLPMKTEQPNYYIGQRVILNDNEIGTVVKSETGAMPFDVWVHSPTKGYASCYAFSSVKPLPDGQL